MVEADANTAPLGAWAVSELTKTANENAGVGADAGLPSSVRFISNVAKLIRRRQAQPSGSEDPRRPAVFLLRAAPPDLTGQIAPKRVPMLDNGLTVVNGRIWFVSEAAVSGSYMPFEVVDDDALFELVTNSYQSGSTPAIIFDPRPPISQTRFYPDGLNNPDNCTPLSWTNDDVTLGRLFDAIENIYKSCLVTPDAHIDPGRLWQNARKWWPSPKAEALIQLNLKAGLVAAFPTCTVRHEQSMPEGRLDLEVEQSDALDRSKITRHAIIELKVLRSFSAAGTPVSESDTLEWVTSGVQQAAAYRDSKGARASALCCFDMRKENSGESCFAHVREIANRLSVELRRWFLHASAKLYREARAGTL